MTALLDYLEAAKVEALATEYRGAGFEVIEGYRNGVEKYDLLARKAEQTIAVEVKARAALGTALDEIRRHRALAQQAGYDYRLIIVNPPRERKIEVDGLESALFAHLLKHSPSGLARISSRIVLDRVSVTDINAIEVTTDGVYVVGTGMAEATIEYSETIPDVGVSIEAEFPLSFDVVLDHQLQVKEARTLDLDVSDFYE